jgi:uncharacterized RDD family membrane protein YckC
LVSAETSSNLIRLPKARTARRLLGSGVEYFTYELILIFLNIVSPFTGGVLGFFATPFILLMVGIRDVKSGAFSIAKRVGGMRVVDYRTGQPISDLQALKRNSYYLVLIVLMVVPFTKSIPTAIFTLLMMIDIMMIIASPEGRRIGDLIAGTQVVQEKRR